MISQKIVFGSAELKGMEKNQAISSINRWAKELKVEEYLQMSAEKLSKGNQQKIQFMTAIIHDPELVVLDEPFSGLDPVNTEILKNIIIDLIRNGKYIIMSAHQMATIEEFCSDILILNKGKTVLQGNLKEIKEKYPANRVEIDVKQDIESYIKELNLEIEIETNNEIKYYRVVRKWMKTKYKYYLQITFAGKPADKHREISTGRVGIDIGTQTIAIASDKSVKLLELADKVNKNHIKKCEF